MRKAAGGALVALGAGALAAGIWGVAIGKHQFRLRHVVAPLLDEGAEPIRVLHLSDIHMAPWDSDAVSWISNLIDAKPHLIVGTGDFLGHPRGLPALREALVPLKGIPGVVVHGSNDRLAPRFKNPFGYLFSPSTPEDHRGTPLDFEGLLELYRDLGWSDINNQTTRMTLAGSVLDFVGVGDAHFGEDDLAGLPARVEALREEFDSEATLHSRVTTIGVTHAPYRRVLDSFATNDADIIFAGHTHGGQVCLPGGLALTTNSDLPRTYASGLHQWQHGPKKSLLHVSAGLGTSIYAPIRLFCPPEATIVTLVGSDFRYAGALPD